MEGIVKRKCAECIYWTAPKDTPGGICRRYPPTVLANGDTNVFPEVQGHQWCGEFKDKWQVRTERVDP